MAKYRWSLWASSDCPSWGTSLSCTSNERNPSRPGLAAAAVDWAGAEGSLSPPEVLPAALWPWWWSGGAADGVAACTLPGALAGPEGWESMDAPRRGPCPTASVGKRREGRAMTRRRRKRASREGGVSTRRTAAQTRVAQISRKLVLAVEGGP